MVEKYFDTEAIEKESQELFEKKQRKLEEKSKALSEVLVEEKGKEGSGEEQMMKAEEDQSTQEDSVMGGPFEVEFVTAPQLLPVKNSLVEQIK